MSLKIHPYMRQHSVQIRCLKANSHETMVEDSIANITDKVAKSVLVVTCRNKQRLLQQAWGIWTRNTNVIHDYVVDLLTIMSRILRDDEYRTELEIEVVCKWVLQNQAIDPTGLAYSLHRCSSRVAVINAIQSARLERYDPGAAVLIQNEMPKPEDGHFTIITGSCEIIAFKSDSGHLLDIHTARKNKQYDIVESLLEQGKVLNKLVYPSGFGELSALTKVNRNACVRAGNDGYLQLLVIPRDELLVCLQHRKIMSSNHNSVPAEVMDFIRQSGLVRQASMTDFMNIASSMTKKVYKRGSILFRKGEPARVLYLIVQGEVFLDTSELQSPSPANPMSGEEELPFQHLDPEKCYFLGAGAMLGDEGICGANHNFESSAVVISELAVFFEVKGIGFDFLSTRVGYEKYTALGYMREKVDDPPLVSYASELVLHGNFTSLRNAIAANNPYRGQVLTDFPASNSTPVKHRSSHKKHQHDTSGALYMSKKIKFTAATVRDAAVAALRTDVVSTVEKNQAVLDRDDNNGVYVLPAAAMYHMHSITKILKKRATQALRASAQEHVLTMRRALTNQEAIDRNKIFESLVSPGKNKTANYTNEKMERAIMRYRDEISRKPLGNSQKIQTDHDPVVEESTKLSDTHHTRLSMLERAALNKFDVAMLSEPLYDQLNSTYANSKLSKIEQYLELVISKKNVNAPPIVARLESVELFGKNKTNKSNMLQRSNTIQRSNSLQRLNTMQQQKEIVVRPNTVYSVGIDNSTHPQLIRLRAQLFRHRRSDSEVLSMSDGYSDPSSKTLSVASSTEQFLHDLKMGKLESKEDMKHMKVPEKLWETRFMKRSDSTGNEEKRKKELKRIMSLPRQLQDDQPEYNQKLNRSSSQDASSEMDGNMVSVVNDTNVSDSSEMVSDAKDYSVDILQNFQEMMTAEPSTCVYVNGRKRASSQSRFGLSSKNKDDSLLPLKISNDVMQDADLRKWKNYCLDKAVETEKGQHVSLPVLSTTGSHSFYWEKKIVKL